MLFFGKYFCLFRHVGIPVYAGSQLLSPSRIVWWWPINWVVMLVVAICVVISEIKKGCLK